MNITIKNLKKIIKGHKKNSGGRNNQGRICVRYKGGFNKQKLRKINFNYIQPMSIILKIEYDPKRNAKIAKCRNLVTGNNFYILAAQNNLIGDLLINFTNNATKYLFKFLLSKLKKTIELNDFYFKTRNLNFKKNFLEESNKKYSKIKNLDLNFFFKFSKYGSVFNLCNLQHGSLIYNIQLNDKKTTYTKAGGTSSEIIYNSKKYTIIKLASGQFKLLSSQSKAQFGQVSFQPKLLTIQKATKLRLKNKRPHVRGVAMNPVDHPHGGGEGKTSGGRPSVTPWGIPTKGYKTIRKKYNYKNILLKKILIQKNF